MKISSAEQVETLLKTQDPVPPAPEVPTSFTYEPRRVSGVGLHTNPPEDFNPSNTSMHLGNEAEPNRWDFNDEPPQPTIDMAFTADMNAGMGLDGNTFTWEMIGLGLEESLPPQDTIDELYGLSPIVGKYAHDATIDIKSTLRKYTPRYP